mgnify:CR=1 FL=1
MTHEKLDKSREPTAVRGQGPYGVAWWTTANRNWGDNIDTNRVNCGSAQVAWEVDCGESGMVRLRLGFSARSLTCHENTIGEGKRQSGNAPTCSLVFARRAAEGRERQRTVRGDATRLPAAVGISRRRRCVVRGCRVSWLPALSLFQLSWNRSTLHSKRCARATAQRATSRTGRKVSRWERRICQALAAAAEIAPPSWKDAWRM